MRRTFIASLAGLLLMGSASVAQESLPSAPVVVETATTANDLLNQTFSTEWISLDPQGGVSGRVGALDVAGGWVPKPGVLASINVNGKVIAATSSDAEGNFYFPKVQPGTYGFTAKSDYSFAAFAIHVYPAGTPLPTTLQVAATRVPAAQARQIIRQNWVPGDYENYYRYQPLDPLGGNRQVAEGNKVRLVDGSLNGRVSRPGWSYGEQDLSGNVAHILTSGTVVTTAPVQKDGTFQVKNLDAGVYDLIVVGRDGVAAIGFEAVGPQPLARNAADVHFVSAAVQVDTLNIELINPSDALVETPEFVEIVPPLPFDPALGPPPMLGGFPGGAGGGMGGGGLGGGGAGGGLGGGGIGGLLGIAGLAAGVAALSDDDSFNANLATQIAVAP
jgi:hypothetical protein